MHKFFSFHGGIHPPENKKQSTRAPIRPAPLPEKLIVPLQQHIGAPAKPCVNTGEHVLKGQVIAKAQGRISVAVHAPSSGHIIDIAPQAVPHPSGLAAPCITIATDGQDEWIPHQGLENYRALPKPELIDYIRDHGIAGMGGAGFPTDVKLHLGDDHIVNTLIINAAECEPYITADDMLIRERADQIVSGIEIINHLLQPSHIMIGIEDNKAHAIRVLEEALRGTDLNIDIMVVPTKYPSGGEKQLIKLLTNVEVPSGRIPADVGIVCQNIGTVAAIHQAVYEGKPLISRIVTVTGEAVSKPQNLEALVGTPFSVLLETSGINRPQLSRLVMGGPMMGFTIEDENIPVIKTSNCIIAATLQEMPPAPPAQACIRCGMCEQVCPAELLPQQLHWFAKSREFEKAKHHNLFDCIECGACSYVCPSNIPLVQYYRFAKQEIRAEEAEQRKAEQSRIRFEARQARLEQEKIEKELRRKERAEQAAKAQAEKKISAEKTSVTPDNHTQPAAPDIKQLKTAAAVARTKLKKAQQALKNATEKGQEGTQVLQATVADLERKANEAQLAFEKADSGAPTSGTASALLSGLTEDVEKAKRTLEKAETALQAAIANNSPAVEKMRAGVDKLRVKYDESLETLQQAQSNTTVTVTEAIDLKALKQQVSIMRTKLKKAEKSLAEIAEGDALYRELEEEIKRLQERHDEAKARLDEAEAIKSKEAQAQGIDLKKLKIDAALARAAVTKAERAIKKAQESDGEDLAQLQAELVAAEQQANQLNQTLSQFE